jgi:hypothetical protein
MSNQDDHKHDPDMIRRSRDFHPDEHMQDDYHHEDDVRRRSWDHGYRYDARRSPGRDRDHADGVRGDYDDVSGYRPRARERNDNYDDYDDHVPQRKRLYSLPSDRGVLILIIAIMSVVLCTFLGFVAMAMGIQDLGKMKRGEMDPNGRPMTLAGTWFGGIVSVGSILILIVFLLLK